MGRPFCVRKMSRKRAKRVSTVGRCSIRCGRLSLLLLSGSHAGGAYKLLSLLALAPLSAIRRTLSFMAARDPPANLALVWLHHSREFISSDNAWL